MDTLAPLGRMHLGSLSDSPVDKGALVVTLMSDG